MHVVVVLRYIYFFLSFSFRIALAAVAGVAVHENVPLVGAPATLFVALFGALVLLGLLLFDLNRTVSGFGFFCFVCKIWFELAIMTLFLVIDTTTFFIVFSRNQSQSCLPASIDTSTILKTCLALQLIWIFQILAAITVFLYVVYLGTISFKHYNETPQVFSAAVRDFPWGIRNAGSKAPALDPHRPIYFPTATLPTYDQAFPDAHKRLEEGRMRQYHPHANSSRL